MGTCTYLSTDSSNSQNALAGLNKWTLERDDSEKEFPHRVYRDKENNIYHSVTHILKETSPQVQKDALKNWLSKPSSPMERDVACERGKLTHSNAEYILKLAGQLSRKTANAKGVWRSSEDGLFRCPPKITQWAIQQATESAPKVSVDDFKSGLASVSFEGKTTPNNTLSVPVEPVAIKAKNSLVPGVNV